MSNLSKFFSDEEIVGEAYLDVMESVSMNQLKLKAGQMIKVMKHIKSLERDELVS